MNDKYRLIYTGQLVSGKTKDEVKEALFSQLKINTQTIEKILSSNKVILKKNIDANQAKKYQNLFKNIGLICHLDKETLPSNSSKLMICPKCGHQQTESDECVQCGVIISKAHTAQEKEEERQRNLAHAKPMVDLLERYNKLFQQDNSDKDRFLVATNITDSKCRAASKKYGPWPTNETVLFLYDESTKLNGSEGFTITNGGLYGKAIWGKRHFYPLDNLYQATVKPGFTGGLEFDGNMLSPLSFFSNEKKLILSEMLHDLSGKKRLIIPFGKELKFPHFCCCCLAPASEDIEVKMLRNPPKSEARKVASFVGKALLFNMNPVTFLIADSLLSESAASKNDRFLPWTLQLPYCRRCAPVDSLTNQLKKTIETWQGNTLEEGQIKINANAAWFDISLLNENFVSELIETNPRTAFTSWINMSTYQQEKDRKSWVDESGKMTIVILGSDGPLPVHREMMAEAAQKGLHLFIKLEQNEPIDNEILELEVLEIFEMLEEYGFTDQNSTFTYPKVLKQKNELQRGDSRT